MRHIYKCAKCSRYSMKEACSCGSVALVAKPVKYSVDDKLANYRRLAKHGEYAERGLI